jgi:hypothetical protein
MPDNDSAAYIVADAVKQDILRGDEQAVVDAAHLEARLEALETRSRITAQVVEAITHSVCDNAPVILELRDNLSESHVPSAATSKADPTL